MSPESFEVERNPERQPLDRKYQFASSLFFAFTAMQTGWVIDEFPIELWKLASKQLRADDSFTSKKDILDWFRAKKLYPLVGLKAMPELSLPKSLKETNDISLWQHLFAYVDYWSDQSRVGVDLKVLTKDEVLLIFEVLKWCLTVHMRFETQLSLLYTNADLEGWIDICNTDIKSVYVEIKRRLDTLDLALWPEYKQCFDQAFAPTNR